VSITNPWLLEAGGPRGAGVASVNFVPSQALLADHDRNRRARVRRQLLRELPGIDVVEAADAETVVRSLEQKAIDLAIVRHPLASDATLPVVLKERWPDHILLLYAPVGSEPALAEALAKAGDAYFFESGAGLPGLRAALRLASSRMGAGLPRGERLRSLEWFAAIFQASPIGMSLGTLADDRLLDVNDRFLELLGRERGEVLGRTWAELGTRFEDADGREVGEVAHDADRLHRVDVRFRTKSGEVRQGLLSIQPVRVDGTGAVLTLLDDLTALRRAEDQRDRLLESERAARAEVEAALDELRESHERLESLSRRLVDVQEAERRAVARELHDEMGQILASLKQRLEGGTAQASAEVQSILGDLLERVRNLSMDLRPPTLDELGLLPTLLWHFGRYEAETGVRVDFSHRNAEGRFPPETETAAFRIVQEALTNVARHARVGEASVRLEGGPDRLVLLIEDRGLGFDPGAAPPGAWGGLAGMQERARLLGGRVRIESAPGQGTRVMAELPVGPVEARTT
jgi:PAS domain S-box-containing protein